MLMKLTPGVNFDNILQADFFSKSVLVKLFTTYSLALNFLGERMSVQKQLV